MPIYNPTSNVREYIFSHSLIIGCVIKLLHISDLLEEICFFSVLVACISLFESEAEQIFMFCLHFVSCKLSLNILCLFLYRLFVVFPIKF